MGSLWDDYVDCVKRISLQIQCKLRLNGQQKHSTYLCNTAAKRAEKRCCAFYQPRSNLLTTWFLQDRFDVGGKTRSIAIQHILQQCCKTSCMLPVFPYLNKHITSIGLSRIFLAKASIWRGNVAENMTVCLSGLIQSIILITWSKNECKNYIRFWKASS